MDAGRAGEFPATELTKSMNNAKIATGRLKTGTPPRIDSRSVNFNKIQVEPGMTDVRFFSFDTTGSLRPQQPCHLVRTNAKVHKIILSNLDRSPLYQGIINAIGPRYCPSIEDKLKKFADDVKDEMEIDVEKSSKRKAEELPNKSKRPEKTKKNDDNKIVAILGFVSISLYDTSLQEKPDIWLAIWKVNQVEALPGVGVLLLKWLEEKLEPHSIGVVGINSEVRKLYNALGFKTGVLNQYYILNPTIKSYKIAKEKFDIKIIIKQLQDIYDEILK